ncbi:hypothetical protein HDU93_000152 [Gonapodya sp. JEL0774]|nr:hypothetical protein HDU93_000152 [Gonapodya sp. JEL0774]
MLALALLSVLTLASSSLTLAAPISARKWRKAAGDCVVTLPTNALSAKGLSTVWVVSGMGCTQNAAGMPTFAECTIVDPATGALSVYSPLLANQGQKTVAPTVPVLPANAVVGCWFGTNGVTTTLKDRNNGADLKAANCVNGNPNVKGDIFGQFAACNAAQFFAAANAAKPQIPALGMGLNGKPCYTTRSFEVVDQDQSDNVVTTYSTNNAGTTIGQKTAANSKTLAVDINNGSDNLLLDLFLRPIMGCPAYMAPNLADPGAMVGSLALNELQAAATQTGAIALVPGNDPMVTVNGAITPAKQTAYRAAVNMGPGAGTTLEAATYCQQYLDINAASIITDAPFTVGFTSPDPANGKDLYTFLAQRFQNSWLGMNCAGLLPATEYINAAMKSPIIANRDANGVTQSVTYNTPSLLCLAIQNGVAAVPPVAASGPMTSAAGARSASTVKIATTVKVATGNAATSKRAATVKGATTFTAPATVQVAITANAVAPTVKAATTASVVVATTKAATATTKPNKVKAAIASVKAEAQAEIAAAKAKVEAEIAAAKAKVEAEAAELQAAFQNI